MFTLHETTQRWLCRIAFLVLCLAPTLVVVSWAAAVNSPQYEQSWRRYWEARLSQRLGGDVAIERVTQPSRSVTLLEGFSLTLPESAEPIATARLIELRPFDGGHLAMASQLELDADRLPDVWRSLHDEVLIRSEREQPTVWLRCAELTLVGSQHSQTFVDVAVQLNCEGETGPAILAEFQMPERADSPCQLAIRRDRSAATPRTTADLQTGPTAMPCAMLAEAFPLVEALGPQAEFRGRLQLSIDDAGYSGQLSDVDLRHVETQRLLSACSLHTFRTIANVHIREARFERGKLRWIQGGVAAEFGVIDARFVAALHEHLQIAAPEAVLDSARDKHSFTQLAFDFSLSDREGLTLQGTCGGAFQSAILVGPDGPLLLQPQRPQLTAVSLIRALVPRNDVQAPATRQTRSLLAALPVPDIIGDPQQRPKAALRLRD